MITSLRRGKGQPGWKWKNLLENTEKKVPSFLRDHHKSNLLDEPSH